MPYMPYQYPIDPIISIKLCVNKLVILLKLLVYLLAEAWRPHFSYGIWKNVVPSVLNYMTYKALVRLIIT